MSNSASQATGQSATKRDTAALWVCLLLTVATVAAYWPVIHADFINYDDTDYVSSNARVQNGLSWKNLAWAFTTRHASNWHPLTWLSHMADVEIFGTGPHGPHTVNLLLHTANACLLFLALRRLTGAHWRSAIAAALFALHPLHVESVAWISERKDVLSTFFGLLALLAYAGWAKGAIQGSTKPQRSKAGHALVVFFFALSLMAKPMLVTLPCVLLLLDFWPLNRIELPPGRWLPRVPLLLIWEKAPLFALSAASCVLTAWAQEKAIQPFEHLPMMARVFNSGMTYLRYLGKTFWPADLSLPYLHPGFWPAGLVACMVIGLTALCVFAVITTRKSPHVFVGWCWYLGTLVPVIGLMQVGIQSMADRYTYLSIVGIFMAVVWSLEDWVRRREMLRVPAIAGVITILGTCGALTFRQAGYWQNGEMLFKHSASVTKDNFIALANVGGVLFESGRLNEAMDYYQQSHEANPRYPESINSIGAILASRNDEKAIEWFERTLELQPTHADALFNLGNAYPRKNNYQRAADYYRSALEQRPDNFEARNNLGNNLFKLGKIDESIAEYRAALDYKPNGAMILKNLGEALAAKGRLDEAIASYRAALTLTNDPSTHYSLGMTLAVQGKWEPAIEQFTATLALIPTNAEAHYNLGYALLHQGKLEGAATHLTEATRLRPDFALAEFNLACVLARTNQRTEAIEHLRAALRIKPDYEDAQKKLRELERGN